MSPLTFSIPLDNPALCPICGIPLLGQVIHVYGSVVFCSRCIHATQYFILNRVIRRCRNSEFVDLFACHSGILVLNPKNHCRRDVLNKLFEFTTDDIEHNYPQFIGIVCDGYFSRSIDAPRTVEDPRHPDYCPASLKPAPAPE